VLAVNNYPTEERFVRLIDSLTDNGGRVSTADWSDSSARLFNGFDGVVLSGSPDMLSEERVQRKFGPEAEAIRDAKVPILGICFGHQLVGHAFGSRVVRGRRVLRFVETVLLARDPLFRGLPRKVTVLESHHEVVERLPVGFSLLARSPTSALAAMKHHRLQVYGLQFHPERSSRAKPHGGLLLANFIGSLK
jgi:GMP synthase-like glutamine amidotransferase